MKRTLDFILQIHDFNQDLFGWLMMLLKWC